MKVGDRLDEESSGVVAWLEEMLGRRGMADRGRGEKRRWEDDGVDAWT